MIKEENQKADSIDMILQSLQTWSAILLTGGTAASEPTRIFRIKLSFLEGIPNTLTFAAFNSVEKESDRNVG